jgi:acetaldehyde dehydrogenase (acetylating)
MLNVAIVGTGNVGSDLLLKVIASPHLECGMFTGRRAGSPGIVMAEEHGVTTSVDGIDAILESVDSFDLIFDATSAADAKRHWAMLEPLGASMVDLTPANLGKFCVPALDLEECVSERYVGMVTCGGQAAVPMAHCISNASNGLDYIEIVSTSAALSVGPATRANMDEYVVTTQRATHEFCDVQEAKTMLVINPSEPGSVMRNTIAVPISESVDMDELRLTAAAMEERIRSYVPGYRMIVPPVIAGDRILLTIEVEGRGDWLPPYAGNLDIITCAAVALAEKKAEANL